jgi:hypothetical protein
MVRGAFSSHSRYHLPKKRNNVPSQNPTLQTPSFPKAPRNRRGRRPHHQKPRTCTVDHAHKALFPPSDEVEHDAPIIHQLIGAYRYDTCMHLCPYAPRRRYRGVGRGQPLTDPSPGTIPHICSQLPDLVSSCPSPFKFTQEQCFLFLDNK